MVTAIGIEHPLHDDFAAFVFEIDVDVGRLVAVFRDKALEQQIVLAGVQFGDAQDVTDRAIGRRSAPLAQDVLRPGISDNIMHCQEVVGVAHLFDQPQFMRQLIEDFKRDAKTVDLSVAVSLDGAGPDELFQGLLRRRFRLQPFVRVLIFQLHQIEAAARHNLLCARKRVRIGREQPRHFRGGLQIAVGVAFAAKAQLIDSAVVADTCDYVLQYALVRGVKQNIVGHDARDLKLRR